MIWLIGLWNIALLQHIMKLFTCQWISIYVQVFLNVNLHFILFIMKQNLQHRVFTLNFHCTLQHCTSILICDCFKEKRCTTVFLRFWSMESCLFQNGLWNAVLQLVLMHVTVIFLNFFLEKTHWFTLVLIHILHRCSLPAFVWNDWDIWFFRLI